MKQSDEENLKDVFKVKEKGLGVDPYVVKLILRYVITMSQQFYKPKRYRFFGVKSSQVHVIEILILENIKSSNENVQDVLKSK